jgi:hypothetical protein
LDRFHELAGLALSGVTEHSEGDAIRLVLREVDEISDLEVSSISVRRRGEARAVFQSENRDTHDGVRIDAAELVAWILSSEGRAALARRGVVVPVLASDGSDGAASAGSLDGANSCKIFTLTFELWPENGAWTSRCREIDIVSAAMTQLDSLRACIGAVVLAVGHEMRRIGGSSEAALVELLNRSQEGAKR